MKSITITDLQKFHENYHHKSNKKSEKQITRHGIERFTLNHKILRENPNRFNLQLPSYHIYDQHDSGRCWCFSGLNLIEGDIAKNLNITPRRLALSANYITFCDKLEKTNYLFNYVLENDFSIQKLHQEVFCKHGPLSEGGYFTNFVNIIAKYGLVPADAMPENQNTNNSRNLFLPLWQEKAKTDALELYYQKSELSAEKLYQLKKQKLSEVYNFLARISGEPPQTFSYKYTNRDNQRVYLKNYTPKRFRDEFLTLDLGKFKLIRCNPLKKFYTEHILENQYSDNPFHPEIKYINLPKEDIKNLTLMQLKSGIPVKIGVRMDIFKHKNINVLDTRLYDYSRLGLKPADYQIGVITNSIKSQHSMVITGAQIENNHPVRWRVENTHADHQFFVMNDNFFDIYLTNVSIYSDIIHQAKIEIK